MSDPQMDVRALLESIKPYYPEMYKLILAYMTGKEFEAVLGLSPKQLDRLEQEFIRKA